MQVTADQAQLFLTEHGWVGVQATSGDLTGHIMVVNHFTVAVRRASH
jgi:hypothetical protein